MPNNKGHQNLEIIRRAVERLGPLAEQVVLLGGCSTGLFLTDPAANPVRKSDDVDVITKVGTRSDYYDLSELLRKQGFSEDKSPDAPLCRWRSEDGVILDVMPTNEEILGFGNRWYEPALTASEWRNIPDGSRSSLKIRVVTPPYFLATKLEAFDGRGKGDYKGSPDMEDLVAVIDGRSEIVADVLTAQDDLREYLRKRFDRLLKTGKFIEALPGHLWPDAASQARLPLIVSRIESMAGVKK